MDYQSLHMKTVAELKQLAKTMNVRVPAGTNKSALIDLLLEADKPAPRLDKGESERADAPASEKKEENAAASAPKRRGRPSKAKEDSKAQSKAEPRPEAAKSPAPAAAEAVSAAKPGRKAGAPAKPEGEAGSPATAAEGSAAEAKPGSTAKAVRSEPRSEAQEKPSAPRAERRIVQSDRRLPAQRGVQPVRQGMNRPAAENGAQRARGYANHGGMRQANGEGRTAQPAQARGVMETRNAPEAQPRMLQRQPGARFAPRQDAQPPREASPVHPAQPDVPAQPEAQRTQETMENGSARGRREGYYNAEYRTSNPAVPEMLAAGECMDGAGVLEIQQDGYGFLRAENCLPGPNDVYISIAQIRRFNLRMGDYVVGKTRPQREGDRYSAMLYITSVNGEPPENAANRPRFEDLVPIYPDERIRLEAPNPVGRGDFSLRLVDALAPIGKGQRGMIVSQPKAGKTTLLKKVANAITAGHPEIELIVLLIDERPEEVTDMKRSIDGEVIYSTFDEAPENHVRVSEMVLERAQRLVEMGKDVVVLMDSITRLARAYNLVITPTGRSLSGGLDPGALFKPKRFFGAARNIENGGSLTVIATALVETGSRMDDIIYEEFKGTGNMELHLDRRLSDKRVFPAIDMVRSGTRREELLLTEAELDGEMLVRRVLSGGRGQEMAEQVIGLMAKTATNAEFFEKLKGWIAVFEKDGYTLGGKG